MRRVTRWLVVVIGVVAALIAAAWWMARPAKPDAFYRPPAGRSAEPGVLLRQQPFDRKVPANARAWRILYGTTGHDGTPTVASAIVVVSRDAGAGPRPVVAWTHGTTGVVPGCAPSLLDDPFANLPAIGSVIDRGWILVATDYVGQGTQGPHPYLVGEGEARSALDAIRALRRMEGVRAAGDIVVWGHSQGGHAALWTGIVAPSYAPDVNLLGVAAIAPASDLRPLVDAVQDTPVGRIMSSFVLRAYSEAYQDVVFDAYATSATRSLARDMAGRCLAGREALFSVAESLLVGKSIFAAPPSGGPLGTRLAQNTPDRRSPYPVLIAQGLADDLVLPEVQAAFARRLCDAGQALDYRSYAGRDHLSVVAQDSPLTPDLVRWTQERFDRAPWSAHCDLGDARTPGPAGTPARPG